ncbi:uncharacterized protein LOC127873064 [Dreissena polymorpha]|uniref:Uncharacterized protein n=1 Tax=Dreissena polymorpha TaxID=45954 RepID=A0A9D4QWG8_DREPO|nr:uncharacterized protein LOC127873064 [Dreissena polymorpha]KAH3845488.1 hypothetical protein DPMN_087769 [Dreissena polymorpha]
MNEKKAILLMLLILHDGRTSRLLPPTNAIVNTKRPEDKFPLEKRSLNMEAPLKYQFGATKTLKMATYQHGTFERTNVTTLQHPSRQGTALRLNQGNFDDMQNIAMNNLQNNHNGSERVQALRRLAKRSLDRFTAIEVSGLMIGAITGALIPIPVLGAIASVFIGVAFSIIAAVFRGLTGTSMRDYLTPIIRQHLSDQAIWSMEMKLRSYKQQIRSIFNLFGLDMQSVEATISLIKQTGTLTSNEVIQTLNTIKRTMDASQLRNIDSYINAFLTDIENDNNVFLIVHDPTESIVFLQEFCMIKLTTFSAALALRKHLDYGPALISNLQSRAKDAAKGCYKFAKWAIHKTAGIVEDNSEHPSNVYNNFLKNVKSKINLDLFSSIGDVDIGEAYLKHGDQISLKHTNRPNTDKRWMSCWGSGNWCKLRSCNGTNAPFETGSQYDYGVACRGEIFWIFGFGRYPNQTILTCDTVGLQYSVWGDDHYWLSKDYAYFISGEFYKTRTCPGNSFESSIWRSGCLEEKFEIQVEGKLCGEKVEDRDAIQLMSKSNYKYVAAVTYTWIAVNFDLIKAQDSWDKPDPWRLYNHNSPTVKPY